MSANALNFAIELIFVLVFCCIVMILVYFTAIFWLKMAYISDIQVFTQEFQQQKKARIFLCI